jgi:RNA polymerase sigma factor (sigma-70 family)
MSDWTPQIERLQAFDDQEWLRVETTFCGRLMAYVSRRVSDLQAREDIVQETFLGSVRGIANFDSAYTFEQYLFGICRNRTIDHLRRRKSIGTGQPADSSESLPGMHDLARDETTPSAIVHLKDLAGEQGRGHELLIRILKDWVQETWQQGEFVRLMVIEALFHGGWRNRDTWQRFELRDETAVAGIKFRALKRLRELAQRSDPSGQLIPALADVASEGTGFLGFDVKQTWEAYGVSCPGQTWLAHHIAGILPAGPRSFVDFHLDEMQCPWCLAKLDALQLTDESDFAQLVERIQKSTVTYLRTRTVRREGGGAGPA